jgi:hypothetical protein
MLISGEECVAGTPNCRPELTDWGMGTDMSRNLSKKREEAAASAAKRRLSDASGKSCDSTRNGIDHEQQKKSYLEAVRYRYRSFGKDCAVNSKNPTRPWELCHHCFVPSLKPVVDCWSKNAFRVANSRRSMGKLLEPVSFVSGLASRFCCYVG